MKKLVIFSAALTMSFSALAVDKHTTKELKAMDCTTLSVEKANSQRALTEAEKNIVAINSPAKSVSKWAGVASKALGAFGGNSETAAKAGQVASNVAGLDDSAEAGDIKIQEKNKSNAQSNIENITTYQKSKKCKI